MRRIARQSGKQRIEDEQRQPLNGGAYTDYQITGRPGRASLGRALLCGRPKALQRPPRRQTVNFNAPLHKHTVGAPQ